MISLSHLNKLIFSIIFFTLLTFNTSFSEDEPADIWKKKENQNEQSNQITNEKDITIESPILSDEVNKIIIKIDENQIGDYDESVIGIFDPEENNFSLNMWLLTDGEDIKKILNRIDKLKLSKLSEDLLFQVLFTNAYSPKKNLNSDEFLKIKIDWLIDKKRIKDLETLLKNNPEVGQNSKAIKFLINEYLSSADVKSACDKINFIDSEIENNYLEKFTIYCLINNNRKDEAQLIYDLLKERGFNNQFFDNKINYLLNVTNKTDQKILDDNLLNFYLSHITSDNFEYKPNDKTDKYIWRFLSSANLIKINDFEDENIIITYEQAASQNSFDNEEIFKIYLRMNFNFNQLINATEIYKTLPNYKARGLIYQSILLSDKVEKKIDLAFLLKDLFIKDSIFLKKYDFKGYRLNFRSKYRAADIEKKRNSIVQGALFEISKSDEKKLDVYEDFPILYKKIYFKYYNKKVMTYIMDKKTPFRYPTEKYLNVIKQGYKDCKLNKKFLTKALRLNK